MNERIKELLAELDIDLYTDEGVMMTKILVRPKDLRQFAELIVRECAGIADGLSKLYPRTDVGFDVGYTMGTTRATKEIKEHFGVEECIELLATR